MCNESDQCCFCLSLEICAASGQYWNMYDEQLKRIETAINKILPKDTDPAWIASVVGMEISYVNSNWVRELTEPGRVLLERGGKRWRSLVCVLTCEALGGGEAADELTPLIEIPHNGSLIIDDIEDDSPTRRGESAIHKIFGEDLAINMGNLMYFLPSIALERSSLHPALRAAIASDWLRVMRRLHLGQGYDIIWHNKPDCFPDEQAYLRMCRLKTGSLSGLAARIGASVAGSILEDHVERESVEELSCTWETLGCAFQIMDDVLNLTGAVAGKRRGDDIIEGKKSLPVIYHVAENPEDSLRLQKLFEQAKKTAARNDRRAIDEAAELLIGSGATRKAWIKGQRLLVQGREELKKLLPDNQARFALIHLIDSGMLRNSSSG